MSCRQKQKLELGCGVIGNTEDFGSSIQSSNLYIPTMKEELFICECNDVQHQIVFIDDTEDKDFPCVYAEILLNPEYNFFKRFWIGVKYIFGHRSKYGYFDEFIFNPKDADRLIAIGKSLKDKQVQAQTS